MEPVIRLKIEKLEADPDLVEFVMAWHGEIGTTEVPFTAEKESRAYQRKINRWTRRDFGAKWEFYWKVILNECWKERRNLVLRRNLFRMEPRRPNPAHRPRNHERWNAICDLRNYFEKVTGQPQMELLRDLFYPNQEEATFNDEWEKRKDWFKDENGAERLKQLELFYKHNRARILETLRTGLPFYAKWESGSAPVGRSGNPYKVRS